MEEVTKLISSSDSLSKDSPAVELPRVPRDRIAVFKRVRLMYRELRNAGSIPDNTKALRPPITPAIFLERARAGLKKTIDKVISVRENET